MALISYFYHPKCYGFMVYKHNIHYILHSNIYPSNTIVVVIIFCLITAITLSIFYFRIHKKNKQNTNESKDIDPEEEEKDTGNTLTKEVATDYLRILSDTALIESFIPEEDRKLGLRILRKTYDVVYGKKSYPWEKAYKAISILYDNLPDKLRQIYPELDEAEIRICCLTYMEVNNTEIAAIMRFKINTVQSKKSVIRKKLGIDGYGNIRDFIIEDLNKLK